MAKKEAKILIARPAVKKLPVILLTKFIKTGYKGNQGGAALQCREYIFTKIVGNYW